MHIDRGHVDKLRRQIYSHRCKNKLTIILESNIDSIELLGYQNKPDDRQSNKKRNEPNNNNHDSNPFWTFMSSIFQWFCHGNIAKYREKSIITYIKKLTSFTDQQQWQPENMFNY